MENNNLSEHQILLLNTLVAMYNDNIRQIENLSIANNEIRDTITGFINTLRNIPQRNTQNTNRYLSNNPYIIDYIHEYTIPINYSTNTQNNTSANTNTTNRLNSISSQYCFISSK